METIIVVILIVAAFSLLMILCNVLHFDAPKTQLMRKQEAERHRKWLDYHAGWLE